jgi:hypothetical protein
MGAITIVMEIHSSNQSINPGFRRVPRRLKPIEAKNKKNIFETGRGDAERTKAGLNFALSFLHEGRVPFCG